jgi:hypothetical protein
MKWNGVGTSTQQHMHKEDVTPVHNAASEGSSIRITMRMQRQYVPVVPPYAL